MARARLSTGMKLDAALGFLSIGLVMLVVPQLAPGLCPRNGFDGSSGRELWLYVMGALQVALGGWGVLWHAVGVLIVAFETLLEAMVEVFTGTVAEAEEELAALVEAHNPALAFEPKADWEERSAA